MASTEVEPTANNFAEDDGSAANPPRQMFDKPNLQLKDPDPYAFANRIRQLLFVFVLLTLVFASPLLLRHFAYHIRIAQQRADYEVATEGLEEIRPGMEHLMSGSRMVAKRIAPSVVSVQRPGFRGPEGQGSGVIVDEAGYILTNFHVVENATAINIELHDGRMTGATVIGADEAIDLAVLKIDLPNLTAVTWGDSDELQAGDLVWAVGSPFGLQRSVTFGIVSAKERRTNSGVTRNNYQEYLQTDVAINPGNSGGPLVNFQGNLVGINTAIIGESYQGISFAIPSQLAKQQYDILRRDGWIERGYLGVRPIKVPEWLRNQMNLVTGEGVCISDVVRPGPAFNAGLRPRDVILYWNDYRADDPALLSRQIAATEVGSTANVVVRRLTRNDEPKDVTVSVTVGVSPNSIRPKPKR